MKGEVIWGVTMRYQDGRVRQSGYYIVTCGEGLLGFKMSWPISRTFTVIPMVKQKRVGLVERLRRRVWGM